MARTDLTQDKSTLNLSTYSTVSIAPGSNRVVLAFVFNVRSGIAQAAQPTAQGNGLTWQAAASIQVAGAPNRRLTCFSATGTAPAAGSLSFDFGGEQQTLCAWSVFEYDGVTEIAQAKTSSGGAPMPSVTLDALADPDKSIVVGGVIANSLFGTPAQVQPGQGLAEIHEQDVTEPGTGGSLQTEDRTGGGTTINWTAGLITNWAAIALELTAGMSAADALKLAERFEPILYFHAAEKFFPSNAKRYIEMCALWRAQSQFDVKDLWGGKGCAFFRARRSSTTWASPPSRASRGRSSVTVWSTPHRRRRFFRFVRLERRCGYGRAESDGGEQEYLLQPQRCRDAIRQRRLGGQQILVSRGVVRQSSAAAAFIDRASPKPRQSAGHPERRGTAQLLLLFPSARGGARRQLHECRGQGVRRLCRRLGVHGAAARKETERPRRSSRHISG